MRIVLLQTLVAQAGGRAPETVGPLAPVPALVIIGLAILLGYGFYRLSNLEIFSRFRPYIVMGLVGLWGLAVVETVFAVSHALTESWVSLGLFLLATTVVTNYQLLRNIMAGLTVAFEQRIHAGDSVRIGEIEGEIQWFGLRAVRVRGIDGRAHEIPNEKFVGESVSNLASGGDSACEVTVKVPAGLATSRAREIARDAAVLTPLASPRHEPEVFVEADAADGKSVRLRVRGYAFDPSQQERFKSEVTRRLLEAFDQSGRR